MNLKSEQLRSDMCIDIDNDDVLSKKEMFNIVVEQLGKSNCEIKEFSKGCKYVEYSIKDIVYLLQTY